MLQNKTNSLQGLLFLVINLSLCMNLVTDPDVKLNNQ